MMPINSRTYWNIINRDHEVKDLTYMVAFARVFSGKLEKGQKLMVMGPTHGFQGKQDITEVELG